MAKKTPRKKSVAKAKPKARRAKDSVPAKGYVAVASTRLLSLEHPALPTGYGFAVVTRDGNARPVGLPVASENVASPPHWIPMSRR